jgi:OmpA-OmpF porin, OOP family
MKATLCLALSAILMLVQSVSAQTNVVNEQFNDNALEWYVGKSSTEKATIKDGVYTIDQKASGGRYYYKKFEINPDEENLVIEAKLTLKGGVTDYGYGIVWSLYSDGSSYNTFLVSGNGMVQVNQYYNQKSHYDLEWTKNDAVNPMGTANTFKIVKNANIITYYLNGKEVFKGGDYSYFGSRIGFFLTRDMEVEIDYIKVDKSPITEIELVEGAGLAAEKTLLPGDINTGDHDKLSPKISPDGQYLYVVVDEHPDNIGDKDAQDIWVSKLDAATGQWGKIKNIGAPLNNDAHNFVVTVLPDNNTLILANQYNPDGTSGGSGASKAFRTPSGWSLPQNLKITDFKNDNDYVSFFMANDAKTLLMAIEKPGGYGLKDLYVSFEQEDGSWSSPKNLGNTVNTFGDESGMFLSSDNKTMFYSTDGLPGYGGKDVFVTKRLDDTWTNWSKPKNLGTNVNTPGFENGYVISADGSKAYIASKGKIYEMPNFFKPEAVVLVKGKVLDKKTGKPLYADIKYYDLASNVEVGIANTDPKTGEYNIILPSGKLYSFLGEKGSYYSVSENLDTKDLKEYKEIVKDLYLTPIEKGATIRLNNIFFETASYTLKKESFNELDRLVKILKDNPGIKIEIGGHTDDVGQDANNLDLSNKRANAVMEYVAAKGIDKLRMQSKGYGETKFLVENTNDENRAINRRVEFTVLEN